MEAILMVRLGILEMASADADRLAYWDIFFNQLTKDGFQKDLNLKVEYIWADGHKERLRLGAEKFVADRYDLIVTAGTPAASAAIAATTTIPIVMATGVSLGTQLSDETKPSQTNITGISDLPAGISEHRLALLRDIVKPGRGLAILADRANPSSPLAVAETTAAGRKLGISVSDYWLPTPDDIDSVLAEMSRDQIGGFVVSPGAMFFAKRVELARLALQHDLATVSVRREYAEAGCTIAYGAPLRVNYSEAAKLAAKILAGQKPSELPIAEPTEFDFLINDTTVDRLGLTIPDHMVRNAEHVRL
jgi:putative ABC transport system substrate-binding protein